MPKKKNCKYGVRKDGKCKKKPGPKKSKQVVAYPPVNTLIFPNLTSPTGFRNIVVVYTEKDKKGKILPSSPY